MTARGMVSSTRFYSFAANFDTQWSESVRTDVSLDGLTLALDKEPNKPSSESVNMGTFRLPEEKKHKCISPKPRQPLVAALVGAIFVVLGHAIFWPCFRKAVVAIIYCRVFWWGILWF